MSKGAAGPLLSLLHLDRALPIPLHRQLYDEIRNAILSERLRPGSRLPSTRTLADELGVSRRTVLDAFLQLYAEGYVEGRIGAGTFVVCALPEDLLQPDTVSALPDLTDESTSKLRLSERYLRQQETAPLSMTLWYPPKQGGRAFMIGVPALDAFPITLWGRMITRFGRGLQPQFLTRDHRTGHKPLREAISAYLAASRGVSCTPDQVMIVNGSQQALSLIAHVLLNPGDSVWMEEPGYFGARGALLGADAHLIPIPVDAEGLDVPAGRLRCPNARLAFVTPSHQMPLGVTMSLSRRLALLEWARSADAWVVEDDYDSEFRYASRPLAALQGLDTHGRVLYTGTFSKVLFPGLRLGYLVVPLALIEAFTTARLFADMHSPLLEQLLVTEFIQEGHFERHIRRMRALYAERQALLVETAQQELAGLLDISTAESGMHLVGWLPSGSDDQAIAQMSWQHGVRVLSLSRQYLDKPTQSGLLLGYAAVPPAEIMEGVHSLGRALRSSERNSS